MKFVVVIPTYNEKENIVKTINALQSSFKSINGHEMHILVTDANSPDKTADEVRNLIKKDSNVHLIVEKEKNGLGAAYSGAMDYAFDLMKADAVITFDGDLSHDATKIPAFVKNIEDGYDFVCGTRYKKGGGIPEIWGFHRKLLSRLGNLYAQTLYFGSGLTDFTSGYKGLTKKVYQKIRDKIAIHGGYTFAISTNIEPIREGFWVSEVPYYFVDRVNGKSKMRPEYFFNAFLFITKIRILDFFASRFGKVFIAGGLGAILQLGAYGLIFQPLLETLNILNLPFDWFLLSIKFHPRFLLSQFLSIEVGVATAYLVNNYWAFSDKKRQGNKLITGFIKNNTVIAGAILIQLAIGQVLAFLFGSGTLRNYVYQVIGILVGLFWNFHFYKKVIWKVKKK